MPRPRPSTPPSTAPEIAIAGHREDAGRGGDQRQAEPRAVHDVRHRLVGPISRRVSSAVEMIDSEVAVAATRTAAKKYAYESDVTARRRAPTHRAARSGRAPGTRAAPPQPLASSASRRTTPSNRSRPHVPPQRDERHAERDRRVERKSPRERDEPVRVGEHDEGRRAPRRRPPRTRRRPPRTASAPPTSRAANAARTCPNAAATSQGSASAESRAASSGSFPVNELARSARERPARRPSPARRRAGSPPRYDPAAAPRGPRQLGHRGEPERLRRERRARRRRRRRRGTRPSRRRARTSARGSRAATRRGARQRGSRPL